MAHWAEINNNNIVVQVLVTSNDTFDEGYQMLIDTFGGIWVKTSYNTFRGIHKTGGNPLRKNYAGVGYTYDEIRDAFIPPKPSIGEWTLDEDTCDWKPVEVD